MLKPFYAMKSNYLISCFYCIIQFGLKKNRRACFRDHVRWKSNNTKTNKKQTQTNNNKKKQKKQAKTKTLLDVITFQIVLHYAFGEINLYNLV